MDVFQCRLFCDYDLENGMWNQQLCYFVQFCKAFFFPPNNIKNSIVTPSEMHIDCILTSSGSEVENEF